MELWPDILIAAFLVIGGFFGLVGSYGLIKLPNPMTRLHAPTKATTLGVGGRNRRARHQHGSHQGNQGSSQHGNRSSPDSVNPV